MVGLKNVDAEDKKYHSFLIKVVNLLKPVTNCWQSLFLAYLEAGFLFHLKVKVLINTDSLLLVEGILPS